MPGATLDSCRSASGGMQGLGLRVCQGPLKRRLRSTSQEEKLEGLSGILGASWQGHAGMLKTTQERMQEGHPEMPGPDGRGVPEGHPGMLRARREGSQEGYPGKSRTRRAKG